MMTTQETAPIVTPNAEAKPGSGSQPSASSPYIPELVIDGIKPFKAETVLEFNERVNILIGPNASGKTTILRILAAGGKLQVQPGQKPEVLSYGITERKDNVDFRQGNHVWEIVDDKGNEVKKGGITPIYLPAMRPNLPTQVENDSGDLLENHLHWLDMGKLEGAMYQLTLIHDNLHGIKEAIRVAQKCTAVICSEDFADIADLTSDYGTSTSNDGKNRRNKQRPIPQERDRSLLRNLVMKGYRSGGRRVRARHDSDPTLEQMCSGAWTTFNWVLYVAIRMARAAEYQPGWEKQSAILLIDEIENHLHPAWQRRVIDALRQNFPNAQLFATTHSPFIVAGRKAGEIHRLIRSELGIISATPTDANIAGWTADEILRTLMDIDEPTDAEAIEARRKLAEYREQGPSNDRAQEEKRQAEILKLQQKVGGPSMALREQFADRIAATMARKDAE